jgi:hypothetical protein
MPEALGARSVPGAPIWFGAVETMQLAVIRRAAQRARDAGANLELLLDTPPARMVREADVMLAMRWPPTGEPAMAALLGMSAGLPVILFEDAITAAWPALDPQTWQPRSSAPGEPSIAVSIDPRDEEHSLMLAMRRLTADPELRADLGAAAHAWWRAHATAARAADVWNTILQEAATLEPPGLPADWPAHLHADGSERARKTLASFGVRVDFLR